MNIFFGLITVFILYYHFIVKTYYRSHCLYKHLEWCLDASCIDLGYRIMHLNKTIPSQCELSADDISVMKNIIEQHRQRYVKELLGRSEYFDSLADFYASRSSLDAYCISLYCYLKKLQCDDYVNGEQMYVQLSRRQEEYYEERKYSITAYGLSFTKLLFNVCFYCENTKKLSNTIYVFPHMANEVKERIEKQELTIST